MKASILTLLFLLQAIAPRGQTGVIAGTVRKPDGSPAAGVRVVAMTADSVGGQALEALAGLAQTDGAGVYRLEGLPPGRYWIAAGPLDFPTYYPGVRSRESATVTTLAPGATITGLNFAFNPDGIRVRGRVEGKAPLDSIRSVTLGRIEGGALVDEAAVESDGTFEFLNVRPGAYHAQLSPHSSSRTASASLVDSRIQIEVKDADLEGVIIPAPASLIGRVEIDHGTAPPPSSGGIPSFLRLRVLTEDSATRRFSADATFPPGADGRFSLNLSPGRYQFDVAVLPIGYDVQITYGNNNLLTESLAVPARLTGREPEIRISLKRAPGSGVKVSGRIIAEAQGGPLPDRVVIGTIVPFGDARNVVQQRMAEAPVSADGTFEFADVPWGSYTVSGNTTGPGVVARWSADVLITDRDVKDVRVAWQPPPTLRPGGLGPRFLEERGRPPTDIPPRPPAIPKPTR